MELAIATALLFTTAGALCLVWADRNHADWQMITFLIVVVIGLAILPDAWRLLPAFALLAAGARAGRLLVIEQNQDVVR